MANMLPSTTSTLILTLSSILLLLAVLTACFVFYQLRLHPLAKHPGPLIGRITPLYDLYHAYKGDKHILLYHLHQKHGTIVRYSPNTLSIDDLAALKAIHSHHANVAKGEFYKCFRAAPNAVSTFLATDKEQHARKRRVVGQAFSEHALRGLEQYVLEHVRTLVNKIDAAIGQPPEDRKGWSEAVDMKSWCNWLVFDIMGDLVFGKSFGTLGDEPENREGIRLLGRAARRNYTVAAMPALLHYGLEKWIPPFRGLYLDRNQYLAFGKKQVMARTKERAEGTVEAGRRDIFSFLLKAKDPVTGAGFPMPELWMEGNTLIVAGSESSSTTLAATLFYLLHNPHTLTTLTTEILTTFPHASAIRHGTRLQNCLYLRACIDEAMRMTPALPGVLPREVMSGGLRIPELELDLPAGVNVGVCTYAIHHHAEYIREPFHYDPTRWLGPKKEALQAVFAPFSLGSRACLGQPLVYMEMSLAIAWLVFQFEMRLAAVQKVDEGIAEEVRKGWRRGEDYPTRDWFMSENLGVEVEFRRRNKVGKTLGDGT